MHRILSRNNKGRRNLVAQHCCAVQDAPVSCNAYVELRPRAWMIDDGRASFSFSNYAAPSLETSRERPLFLGVGKTDTVSLIIHVHLRCPGAAP